MTFEPSPAAREMAEALRAGVSARLRDFDAATPEEDLLRFRMLGAIEDVAPVAKPSPWSAAVRAARRMLRGLMRPWLAAQSAFNGAIAEHAVQTAAAAHATARRVRELERQIERLRDAGGRLEAGAGSGVEQLAAAGGPLPSPRLDRDTLLRLLVHGRIRRPPARVLVCGVEIVAQDLQAFGYEVVVRSFTDALHEPSASFDACVLWRENGDGRGREWRSTVARLLRPGGQGILIDGSGAQTEPAPEGLAVSAVLMAQEEEAGWTVAEGAPPVSPRRAWPDGALAVIVVERPHAPGR